MASGRSQSVEPVCEPHTACRTLCARLNDSPSQDISHDCECPLHVGKDLQA